MFFCHNRKIDLLLRCHFLFLSLKATLSAINVAALPDKGEKLQIQIKELEDELESLSLSAASHTGEVSATLLRFRNTRVLSF